MGKRNKGRKEKVKREKMFEEGITQKEYEKNTEEYWLGKKVMTLRKLENGNVMIPTGAVLTIHRKYKGFTLKAVTDCPYCKIGVKLSITRVPPNLLKLVEEGKA